MAYGEKNFGDLMNFSVVGIVSTRAEQFSETTIRLSHKQRF